MIGEKEKCTDKGKGKHGDADSLLQSTMAYSMFVPNFKILGRVVPEKSLMEKKLPTDTQTNIVMEKAKTIYPYIRQTLLWKRQKLYIPIFFICRGYKY